MLDAMGLPFPYAIGEVLHSVMVWGVSRNFVAIPPVKPSLPRGCGKNLVRVVEVNGRRSAVSKHG